MADSKTLHCNLITPDRQVFECDATSISLPAHDGSVGFLTNRAPLLCKLGVGELTVESPGSTHRYFLDGGFAQMLNNDLTILTEHAEESAGISAASADADLANAAAMTASDPASRAGKDAALARARARKRIASSRR